MHHVPVSSSNLASVGYDALTQTLEVAFQNGSLYSYAGVPAAVHQDLMSASSHGTYFSANIRNKYPTRKLR
ncbi:MULTISPECIES: KTSC domain-containing protein [unclassified Deinococcus]|uniref:KTSC domain-containing protein n=1 Tax=unclassified Deinococcus TaxID=2623546 RepID=UPI0009933FEA|nr:KTSC domain-containing protein [Deinococcus sp. RIT780]NTX99137.1 KTSC domain-containing protein [Deinococcus sp. JMULE3]OOV12105.1 KTSC domain-containing protein [Deinococcus sp. LM3]